MDKDEPQLESLFETPNILEQERMLEAVLFSINEPITKQQLEKRMPIGCDVSEALIALKNRYADTVFTIFQTCCRFQRQSSFGSNKSIR